MGFIKQCTGDIIAIVKGNGLGGSTALFEKRLRERLLPHNISLEGRRKAARLNSDVEAVE